MPANYYHHQRRGSNHFLYRRKRYPYCEPIGRAILPMVFEFSINSGSNRFNVYGNLYGKLFGCFYQCRGLQFYFGLYQCNIRPIRGNHFPGRNKPGLSGWIRHVPG